MNNTPLPLLTPQALDDWEVWLRKVTDIPSAASTHPLPLDRVGVVGVRVPLHLDGFADALSATVEATTSLASDQRGIHMSRLVEDILKASSQTFRHPIEFVNILVLQARQSQCSQAACVGLKAEGFTDSTTICTAKPSKEPLTIHARAEQSVSSIRAYHGVRLQILTACPCTQTHFRYELARTIAGLTNLTTANVILPHLKAQTHVQRGVLECEVEDQGGLIHPIELVGMLGWAVTTVRELLKRPDEHALVDEAHRRAQFTEDVVRDAAASIIPLLKRLPPRSVVRLRAFAEESIHPHNAEAALSCAAEEILEHL